jgi:hypothetical protein
MRREDYTKDEWGQILADRWDRLDGLHKAGVIDEHPGKAGWNADSAVLRRARDGAGSGLGARELEENDQPKAQDDDNPTGANPPRAPERNGAALAAHDSGLKAALNEAIPGLDRVGLPGRDGRTGVVDSDLIVQSGRPAP